MGNVAYKYHFRIAVGRFCMHAILLWQRNVALLPTIIISVSERYKKLASKQN